MAQLLLTVVGGPRRYAELIKCCMPSAVLHAGLSEFVLRYMKSSKDVLHVRGLGSLHTGEPMVADIRRTVGIRVLVS